MTNREWLNALDDEKFADFLDWLDDSCRVCAYHGTVHKHTKCKSGVMEWLKR